MARDLEAPAGDPAGWSAQLYRAIGDEIPSWRPIFTGDIFAEVAVTTSSGNVNARTVIVLQHPCAMRLDGLSLSPRQLVCEVRQHRPLDATEWSRFGKLMPLSDLHPELTSNRRNQAAMFDVADVVASAELLPDRRIACLTELGVNLLLQRWVHHSTRVVVPTSDISAVTGGPFEEADLAEEWCGEGIAAGIPVQIATADCLAWLREEGIGTETRQRMLESPQYRSAIRRDMRVEIRKRFHA